MRGFRAACRDPVRLLPGRGVDGALRERSSPMVLAPPTLLRVGGGVISPSLFISSGNASCVTADCSVSCVALLPAATADPRSSAWPAPSCLGAGWLTCALALSSATSASRRGMTQCAPELPVSGGSLLLWPLLATALRFGAAAVVVDGNVCSILGASLEPLPPEPLHGVEASSI